MHAILSTALLSARGGFESSRREKRQTGRENYMNEQEDMRDDYGDVLKDGVRGKYYEQFKGGVRAVLLDDDVAEGFTDSAQVNAILRALLPTVKKEAS